MLAVCPVTDNKANRVIAVIIATKSLIMHLLPRNKDLIRLLIVFLLLRILFIANLPKFP